MQCPRSSPEVQTSDEGGSGEENEAAENATEAVAEDNTSHNHKAEVNEDRFKLKFQLLVWWCLRRTRMRSFVS